MPVESAADKKARTKQIVTRLKKAYPDSHCSLDFKTTHQLLVATILSAQCTDERVNKVTPELFKKYKSVRAFADADMDQLQKDVFATGFYVNKAKAIKNSAQQLVAECRSKIPRTIAELTKLTGIGRKTASVILGVGYGIAEGIVVDTHVGRISTLLGLTKQKEQTNAVKIERDLIELVSPADWIIYSHLMIDHGRAVCIARRPKCADCTLAKLCPSAK
jgi:endonuclease-3